ncbi:MAG: SMP-30/gluconolactonase/LRE family protein [Hyphomicrobiales bacterium]
MHGNAARLTCDIGTTRLFDCACDVGESPTWDADTSSLWWVDIEAKALLRGGIRDGVIERHVLSVAPSFIAAITPNAVLLAADRGWYTLNLSDQRLSLLAEPETSPSADWRMNDGVIDFQGRLWTGSIGLPRGDQSFGALYRWDADGVHVLADDLLTQNGLAISPDGRTLYLADSHPSRAVIWAFDLDSSDGSLSGKRVFHTPQLGRPDGAAIDCEGGYWVALIDAGTVARLSPDGTITHRVSVPVSRPTNVCFGGDGMRQAFVTSMRVGLDDDALEHQPDAGAVFTFEAPFAGLVQPIPNVPSTLWPSDAMPANST